MMFRCFCYFYNAISVSESGVTHDVNSKTFGRNTLFLLVGKRKISYEIIEHQREDYFCTELASALPYGENQLTLHC